MTRYGRGVPAAFVSDVRHAGIRPLLECDLWFDCTDDPALAWPLTELSNGLAKPLLRCAVDGSGQTELGRVLCSSGGAGHACQVCSYSLADFLQRPRRTPCPGQRREGRPPTLAGGAIGAGTAGLALSLGQRLITGNDAESVLDHEFILDWTNFQLIRLRLPRSDRCLSGHQVWEWLDVDITVQDGTLRDLFRAAQRQLETTPLAHGRVSPPAEPAGLLSLRRRARGGGNGSGGRAALPCAVVAHVVVGGNAASIGALSSRPTTWEYSTRRSMSLGIPAGALIVATSPGRPTLRMLLP